MLDLAVAGGGATLAEEAGDQGRHVALGGALQDADREGYAQVCDAMAEFDVRRRLGEIEVPVLAVAGAEDVTTPPELLADIASQVQHGRLVVLDHVAHLAAAEAPYLIAQLVEEHLSGGPAAEAEEAAAEDTVRTTYDAEPVFHPTTPTTDGDTTWWEGELPVHNPVTHYRFLLVRAGVDGQGEQVTLRGPKGIRLRSATVQTFALAIHELATNALKYGALSRPEGRLEVKWSVLPARPSVASGPGERWLKVNWSETGVPPAVHDGTPEEPDAPTRRTGYGRELIERARS